MLEDRDYMRSDYPRHRNLQIRWTMTGILIATLVGAYILQSVFARSPYLDYLVLSTEGLRHGYLWQLITFQFLHASLWHLVGNLIGVYFLGRYVEQRLGSWQLLRIYLLSGVAGGILQAGLALILPHIFGQSAVVGASAGVFGLLAILGALEPEARLYLYFLFPVKAKHVLWFSLAVSVLMTIIPSASGIAHAAHLGGLLFGWLYVATGLHTVHHWSGFNPLATRQRKRQLVKTAVKTGYWRKPKPQSPIEVPPGEFISREVDPILDKISAHGIQSLTERERKILEAARSKMAKR